MTTRQDRPISVQIGVSPRMKRDSSPPPMCLVGLASWKQQPLSQLYPQCLVRNSVMTDDDVFVEHIRLHSREALHLLPGLEFGRPSRIRDAARIAIAAGAKSIDLVIARVRAGEAEFEPWELHRPEFVFAIDPFLAQLVGTTLVYPDIGGPVSVGPGTSHEIEERVHRFRQTVAAHKSRWTERFQLALLDDPGVTGTLGHSVLRSAIATDSAIVRWAGEPDQLRGHGWRSGGALVAGLLASRPQDLLSGVSGFRVPLAPGRAVDSGRARDLFMGDRYRASLPEDGYYVDVVPDGKGSAYIRSEATMRAPVGSWSIPAIRVAKVIHWRVMQSASRFVFESADIGRAVGLSTAVSKAVRPFVRVGVLTGPGEESEPIIRGGVVRDPAQPGLRVEITAQIKPWAHRMNLRVNLRPGGSPVVKEVE